MLTFTFMAIFVCQTISDEKGCFFFTAHFFGLFLTVLTKLFQECSITQPLFKHQSIVVLPPPPLTTFICPPYFLIMHAVHCFSWQIKTLQTFSSPLNNPTCNIACSIKNRLSNKGAIQKPFEMGIGRFRILENTFLCKTVIHTNNIFQSDLFDLKHMKAGILLFHCGVSEKFVEKPWSTKMCR